MCQGFADPLRQLFRPVDHSSYRETGLENARWTTGPVPLIPCPKKPAIVSADVTFGTSVITSAFVRNRCTCFTFLVSEHERQFKAL